VARVAGAEPASGRGAVRAIAGPAGNARARRAPATPNLGGCPMDAMAWIALAIFAITIVAVVGNVIDGANAALVGVAAMIWFGVMTEVDAFGLVDWNVMAILISIWIIAGYFGKSGVPSWLSVQALRLSGGHPGLLVMILSVLAGVISMFVDHVVVILMMAPVALPLARALKLPVTPEVLMIGLCANSMGAPLLLGDLPAGMLKLVLV